MERAELELLLADIESDRAERTVSAKDKDKLCEAICSFSNDMAGQRLPGYLFIGANPDGTASGLEITDRLLLELADIRSAGNILPLPALTVQKWKIGGGEMAVVEVLPSDMPPVRYKGRIHIRVGPRKAVAGEQEERILSERRTFFAKTWDARACPEATLDDLALDLFNPTYVSFAVAPEVLEANGRTPEKQLAALRFYDLKQCRPTNAAILLFGKSPSELMPGAYIQYVAYEGRDRSADVSRERRFEGDLLNLMRDLDRFCDEIAGARPVPDASSPERIVYDYPPKTIRELLMNSVIHRNYDGSGSPIAINQFVDRVEILNPGGLYPDVTPETLSTSTAYRNPILAEAAKTLGFVNRYGRGIAIARAELNRNGSPPPIFEPGPNHFLASIRKYT